MLAKVFKKKNKALLGVDISSTSVKLLELSQVNGRYRVEGYAREALPANAVIDQNIEDDEAVGEAVRKAFSRIHTTTKQAAVAVSGAAAITKVIQMPEGLSDSDMDLQVRAEADQHIPYPLDEVALDWEVQGPSLLSKDRVDVLLAACRSETVERRKDAAEYSGLNVTVVDVEAYCVERASPLLLSQLKGFESETIAIVDIGMTTTSLNVVHHGKSIYTREQLFGERQLIEEASRRYAMSEADVIRAQAEGGLPSDYEAEVLEPFRRSVVQQISRSLQFFYSSSQFNDVDCIVLAGSVAPTPRLVDMVQDALAVPTVVANPFVDMTLSNNVNPNLLSSDASSLLVACGLAMRSFA